MQKKIKNEKQQTDKTIAEAFSELSKKLETNVTGDIKDAVVEIDVSVLINSLPQPKAYKPSQVISTVSYKPISQYPFALRDVAVWTPSGTTAEDVVDVIRREAGKTLIRYSLFDTFEKEGKVSYAFHLVFQSNEKTFSEEELTSVTDKVYSSFREKDNWEVR